VQRTNQHLFAFLFVDLPEHQPARALYVGDRAARSSPVRSGVSASHSHARVGDTPAGHASARLTGRTYAAVARAHLPFSRVSRQCNLQLWPVGSAGRHWIGDSSMPLACFPFSLHLSFFLSFFLSSRAHTIAFVLTSTTTDVTSCRTIYRVQQSIWSPKTLFCTVHIVEFKYSYDAHAIYSLF
jgi:hypothetical protein